MYRIWAYFGGYPLKISSKKWGPSEFQDAEVDHTASQLSRIYKNEALHRVLEGLLPLKLMSKTRGCCPVSAQTSSCTPCTQFCSVLHKGHASLCYWDAYIPVEKYKPSHVDKK